MFKALLTFSNGETLELHDGQRVVPIVKYTDENGDISVSKDRSFEVWYHVHDGLIPSIAELLCKFEFFHLLDEEGKKIYKTSAVVSVENL